MRILSTFLSLVTVSLCLAALPAGASVFSIEGESWNGWIPLEGLPWEKAYETEMIVNGHRKKMHLYSARYTEPVLSQLQQRISAVGGQLDYVGGADGFTGLGRMGEHDVEVLVTSPPSEPRHLVFLTYRSPDKKQEVRDPVRAYPNSERISSVVNKKTQSIFLTLKTPDTGYEVHAFYEDSLLEQGWNRMMPSKKGADEPRGMAVFQKRNKVCYIQVRQNKDFSSIITILVKKGTM